MKEVWKDVVGYEGLYQVSNLGRIKSLLHKNQKILKPAPNPYRNGYTHVVLRKDGKSKVQRVHRLVAIAFIPNPNNLPEVNHKDKNTANNNVDNLEWCTKLYNLQYSQIPEMYKSMCIEASKRKRIAVDQYSMSGDYIATFDGLREAGRAVGGSGHNIKKCCIGKFRYVYGYVWRFKGDSFDKYSINDKSAKPIIQYSLDGKVIAEWESMAEAEKTGRYDTSAVSRCCRGIQKTSYGYVWRYKNT